MTELVDWSQVEVPMSADAARVRDDLLKATQPGYELSNAGAALTQLLQYVYAKGWNAHFEVVEAENYGRTGGTRLTIEQAERARLMRADRQAQR